MSAFWLWLGVIVATCVVLLALLFVATKWLLKREPYSSFVRLRTVSKLRFFRSLMTDRRIPIYVKLIPVLTVIYLASPIDLIPDFIPVIGYMDDVGIVILALGGVIFLSPRVVIDELLLAAAAENAKLPAKPDGDDDDDD